MIFTRRIWTIISLALILTLILIPNRFYHWDGLVYAYQLENVPLSNLFHQHHLLFTPVCKILYLIINSGGGDSLPGISFLISFNILVGLVFLSLTYCILKLLCSKFWFFPLLGTVWVASSYTFCSYFRNPNAYILPVTILSVSLYRQISAQKKIGRFKITYSDWFLLLLSTLFHQLSLLAYPAILYAQLKSNDKGRIRKAVLSTVLFLLLLIVSYAAAYSYVSEAKSISGFSKWLTGYAGRDFWVFNDPMSFNNKIETSFYESIMSYKALFTAPINRLAVRLYSIDNYGFSKSFGESSGWFIFLMIVFISIYGLIKFKKTDSLTTRNFFIFWILPYFILLQFYCPYLSYYRLFYFLPLFIFFMKGLEEITFTVKSGFLPVFLLIMVIAFNSVYGYIPESKMANNEYLVFSTSIDEWVPSGSLVLFDPQDYFYAVHTMYFSDRDTGFITGINPFRHADVNLKELSNQVETTLHWMGSNYDYLYISSITHPFKAGYAKIKLVDCDHDDMQVLLLERGRLDLEKIRKVQIAGKKFEVTSFTQ